MQWRRSSIVRLAEILCGNTHHFSYLSSSHITAFFYDCDLDYEHDGSTRASWIAERLKEVLALPHPNASTPPDAFVRIIRRLLENIEPDKGEEHRAKALAALNAVLAREGWEAFYDEHRVGQLRHIATNTVAEMVNPHRPLTPQEVQRRDLLAAYLDRCSEDKLIEEVLVPLFRQLGFHRITPTGHDDKLLEYGKDIWMKFILPTGHILYFGVQVKRGKLDASGKSKGGSSNIAEVLNQAQMMIGHEVFDPEVNRRVLVDHVFIISGGEITKQAKNWLGERLDASKRSQIMFMDREDILNLFIVTNLPLPSGALSSQTADDPGEIPF